MSDHNNNPDIQQLLLEAVPAPDPAPHQNWDEALRRSEDNRTRQNGKISITADLLPDGDTTSRQRGRPILRRRWLVPALAAALLIVVGGAVAGVGGLPGVYPFADDPGQLPLGGPQDPTALDEPAIATDWWFQRDPTNRFSEPRPVTGEPGIVATGQSLGKPWTVIGYFSSSPVVRTGVKPDPLGRDMVCVSTIVGRLRNRPAGTGCSVLHGMPNVSEGRRGGWITHHAGGYGGPALSGAVGAGVEHLQLVSSTNGKETAIDVPLTGLPNVEGGIRFFAIDNPGPDYDAIVALDADGHELERLTRNNPALRKAAQLRAGTTSGQSSSAPA